MASDAKERFLSLIDREKVPPNPQTSGLYLFEDKFIRQDIFISTQVNEYSPVPIVLLASLNDVQGGNPSATTEDGKRTIKLPLLFLLHGTSKSNKSLIEDTKLPQHFASLGFLVVLMDARYHGERLKNETDKANSPLVYLDKLDEAYVNKNGEMPFIYDNVWDLLRVLDYLELQYNQENYTYTMGEDDKEIAETDVNNRTIISIEVDFSLGFGSTGISLGGMHSWFLAFVDSRITCLAPAIGVQNFRWAVENDKWQARVDTIKKPFLSCMKENGKSEIDKEIVRNTYSVINPGLLDDFDIIYSLPTLVPRPLLVMNGELDPRCPINGMEEFMKEMIQKYDHAGKIENFEYHWEKGVYHDVTPDMVTRITYFLLKNMIPASPHIQSYEELVGKLNQKCKM